MDWQGVIDAGMASTHRIYGAQEEYLREVERDNKRFAAKLWQVYMCRLDRDALAWLEALPEPPGDLADAGRDDFSELVVEDDGTVLIDLVAPRLTQDVELYALARRLGADVPDWISDDVLPW